MLTAYLSQRTKHHQSIVKGLNIARKAKKISSIWTFDGRFYKGNQRI